ncbi:DUF922 domain-containing Zn-dependent protease [Liberibacter crescens]|uniref:DUF922 domain-containing Zn-dependent protease n=1 Tax=Liberibacter crescens TaxID=1273132 RepID=UPI00244DDF2F|nr:DUF922 domain-containing protein [Liberibacter crescens]
MKNLDEEIYKHSTSGLKHPGIAQIDFDTQLFYKNRNHFCYPSEPVVTLTVRIILPYWKNKKYALPEIALIWDSFSFDIKRHEEHHAEIARIHAHQLYNSLKSLKKTNDCRLFQKNADKITRHHMNIHDKDQHQFDIIDGKNFSRRIRKILVHHIKKSGF